MQFKKLTLSLFAASALILGPVALDAQTSIDLGSSAQAAQGGNGNGNGGGNGGGSSNSNRGGSGNSSAKASSSFDDGNSKRGNALGHTKDKSLGNDRGAIASKLGALNAAHASANARLHASPNSRVGLIATYERAVLDGQQLSLDYQAAVDELTRLEAERDDTLPENTSIEQLNAIIDLNTQFGALTGGELSDEEINSLAVDYELSLTNEEGGDKTSDELASELSVLMEAELAGIDIDNVQQKIVDYNAYGVKIDAAELAAQTLEAQTATQAASEVDALESAANKTLSAEVVDEVNRLLGIESAYRAPGDPLPTEPDAPADS